MSFNNTPLKTATETAPLTGQQRPTQAANKFRSSLVPMGRPSPGRSLQAAGKVPALSGLEHDLFTTKPTPKPSRVTQFSPKLPAAATKPSPGVRKFAPQKSATAGMAGTQSADLFKMRIPSPDPELTGETLAKSLPKDLLGQGKTVYADAYLAHKCPPEFDELQRRQFFCILDLRRLKFAANSIFAKKDWKLNILNFAREYDKSRGLIMLHYGLYEFKNVKPSAEVMKRWRAKHDLPDSEPEPETAAKSSGGRATAMSAGSTKRKAEDDLPLKNNVFASSTTNQNKRRNLELEPVEGAAKFAPSPTKSKRKADDTEESDENQRGKLQKATPSAAKSRLESIINNVQSGSSTPAGSPIQSSLFGTSTPTPAPLFGNSKKSTESQSSLFGTSEKTAESEKTPFGTSNKVAESQNTLFGTPTTKVTDSQKTPFGTSIKVTESQSTLFGTSAPNKATEPQSILFGTSNSQKGTESQSTLFSSKPNNPFGTSTNGATSAASKLQSSQFQPGNVLNGNGDGSVLSGHKFGSAPTTTTSNPFSYLSESSANNSGDENGNADGDGDETGSEHESEPETGSQGAAPSYEPSAAASTGTNTPPTQTSAPLSLFPMGKAPAASNIFGPAAKSAAISSMFGSATQATPASNLFGTTPKAATGSTTLGSARKPEEAAAKGGLFGRVSFGSDGQPLRSSTPAEEAPKAPPSAKESAPETEQIKTPAKPPGDYTFNPATTPISFGAGSSTANSILGSKPATEESSTSTKESEDTEKAPALSTPSIFGANPSASTSTSAQPLFGGFNKALEAQSTAKEQPKNIFGAQPSFGALSPAKEGSAPPASSLFGGLKKTAEPEKSASNGNQTIFNTAPNSSAPSLFEATKTEERPTTPNTSTSFGTQRKIATPKGRLGQRAAATNATSFFKPAAQASSPAASTKRSFDDSESQPAKRPMFGAPKPDQAMDTDQAMETDKPEVASAQPATSMFGGASSTLFGTNAPKPNAPAASSIFGNSTTTATPSFQFGSAPAENKPETSPAKSNPFGSTTPAGRAIFNFGGAQNNTATPSQSQAPSSGFQFGANQDAAPAISFGGADAQPNGSASTSFDFNFTSGSGGGGSSAPFTFGQGQGQVPSSDQGSFTFTAGAGAGGRQSVSNPFAASSTPTPNGSFNFQFGGQGPSAPNAAPADQNPMFGGQPNGSATAPGFSFTSTTPTLYTPNGFGSKPFGSLLQPGGGNAAGANSPFPAGSSMNTTPVNGTPEPHTQQEDGDAAPPEEQIKLTEGGPGEEDEIIIYEVRSKAIQYVPVDKLDDSQDKKKSPWVTQGVGPLRILKNKTTGNVRMLLRGEPRGQIVMNKTILADIDYKADGKTVKFLAANDDGSGLETWVLQVKKPEMAAELAGQMEANKMANKN